MVSTPAQSSIKSSPNSEILRQRPSAPKSRTKSTLGFVSDGCFLVFHLFGELLKNRLIERNTASTLVCSKIAYEKYVRFCFRRVFPCLSSVWRAFKKNVLFSEILRQRSSPANSCTYCTLELSFEGCFLVFHLFGEVLKKCAI